MYGLGISQPRLVVRSTMTATSGRWSLVGVGIASSLVLFLGVTMRTRIQDADGIALALYGFPLRGDARAWPRLARTA